MNKGLRYGSDVKITGIEATRDYITVNVEIDEIFERKHKYFI